MTASKTEIFRGCMPVLMTPCSEEGQPDYEALVKKGKELIGLRIRSWPASMLSMPGKSELPA